MLGARKDTLQLSGVANSAIISANPFSAAISIISIAIHINKPTK